MTLEVSPELVEPCLRFYALLGFERRPAPPTLAGRAEWLERAGTQVHVMPRESAGPPAGGGHFAVVVGPWEETLAALRGAGHEPEPRREHWGAPRAYVRDPAGQLVELMAAPPGPPPG